MSAMGGMRTFALLAVPDERQKQIRALVPTLLLRDGTGFLHI
jgi:hypothetical protein